MTSDKIDPEAIAEETGVEVQEVRLVLSHLIPNWLFARFIDDDMDDVDYYELRR